MLVLLFLTMADGEEDLELTPGYKAPKKEALDDIVNKDKDDEALNRWKASLLAGVDTSGLKTENK